MLHFIGAAATVVAALLAAPPAPADDGYRAADGRYVVASGDRHVRGAERLPYPPGAYRTPRGADTYRGGPYDGYYPRFYGDLRRGADARDGQHGDARGWRRDGGEWRRDQHDWGRDRRRHGSHEWDHPGHVPRQRMGPRRDSGRHEGIPPHHFHGYREHAHPDGFDGRGLQSRPFVRDGGTDARRGGGRMGGR